MGDERILPEEAWEAFYPAGSINPGGEIKGGFGFYMKGPKPFEQTLERKDAVEVVCGYEVMFEEGFEWVKGGKLPGVYGGIGDSAYGCTGGRKEQRCNCFNLRIMWRANGEAELYAYLPLLPSNTRALLSVPDSHENSDYGFSVGRGAWRFESGKWFAVATRVKLNEVGREDGELDVFVDGHCVISVRALVFRQDAQSKMKGMHFQTFFGGHTPDWASPKDQRAWFASVSGAVLGDSAAHQEYSRDEL
ncbi:uncharacterized protein STEHIDRAFT_87240 [Stereum hirsutum FP-91666 SS1]|uniref:uncharacterized protein n=1 Tax=Stereum hirsutum (strain FP-91666) TaxID=721885 RepID=UPI000444A7B3|nr:uncharacterized protein STEHIDRAFT_87240 [Stereum hirsutum FP-91666 SS1]EIM80912.1 hypothetical protein STEHIDRAFT_87240 [Stereum hirsutum FP-91666 SS1]